MALVHSQKREEQRPGMCLSRGHTRKGRLLLLFGVVVESFARLGAQPAGVDVLDEQRRRAELVLAQLSVQHTPAHMASSGHRVQALRPTVATYMMARTVSRPIKSARVRGPMGMLQPSFSVVSMSSREPNPCRTSQSAVFIECARAFECSYILKSVDGLIQIRAEQSRERERSTSRSRGNQETVYHLFAIKPGLSSD